MSFLGRLSVRALPALSRMPAVTPKGLAARHAPPLYREAAPPEEDPEIAPWRTPASLPLRRADAPSGEDEEMARAPAAEPPENEAEVKPARIRRAAAKPSDETEEPVAPLRRATTEEDEPQVAPLLRAEAPEGSEEEPPAQPMRTIRRAEEVPLDDGEKPLRQPFQADLVPGAMPSHPDLANDEEPSQLQALRRAAAPPRQASTAAPPPTPPPAAPRGADAWPPRPEPAWAGAEPGFAPEVPAFETGGFAPAPAPGRTQVVIDQLDVVIHEPTASAPARAQADHGRLMRARYLRRL